MNTAVAAFGMGLALLLSATAFAAQTDGAPASAPGASPQAIQRRLQRTQAELQHQRAQTEQLKARVTGLEQRSADNRTELERRDREIAQLQRKLQALSAPAGSAPASGRSR